ncbi:hypothetical protein SEPCBS119000_004913 [Sporothrix epigloea]|uniref:Uncharacterized protein n=1 Tax=Sporothrix epigloea TaxID=1892477 RepID=A0ABP0DVX6_9PEZI
MAQPPDQLSAAPNTIADLTADIGGGLQSQAAGHYHTAGQPPTGALHYGLDDDLYPHARNNAHGSSSSTSTHFERHSERIRRLLGYTDTDIDPPLPTFDEDMRDMQARGKDPYEYARKGDSVYEDRIGNLRKLKITASSSSYFSGPAVVPNMSIHLQQTQPTQQAQQAPALHGPGPHHYGHYYPHHGAARASGRVNPHACPPLPAAARAHDPPLDCFHNLERRRRAALVLDSPELLMMYAQSTNDSIPSVRMKFMSELCGLDSETMTSQAATADRRAEIAFEKAVERAALQDAMMQSPAAGYRPIYSGGLD